MLRGSSSESIRRCPRCRAPIAQAEDGGCNRMSCALELHFLSPSGCTFWGREPWSRRRRRRRRRLGQLGLSVYLARKGWGSPWRWPTSTGRCSSLRWRKSGTRARSTRKRKRGSWRSWPQRKGLQEPQGLAIAASNTSRSPAESPAKASPEEEEEEEEEEGDGGAAWTEERRRDGRRAPPSPGQRPLCRPIPALWHGFSGSATQRRPCREHRPQADSQVCKEEGKPPGFCFHA
ncbi:uncharacterized protein LOC121919995 isoform X5 [Sceloporus undulatus]|uniref:uncharacterized protein LOC121919995 isoform X5 n=1 Tax=Sceloporus undulatus TaxID=8520 RepID=UPI001C4ACCAA|nr:uncharacterized protein LOC121919995 isoform X5 [Sceloporus undulatus]